MKNTTLKRFLIGIGLFLVTLNVCAQNEITVTGEVIDSQNEPLIGASIVVKNQPGFGTTTDVDGKYRIKVGVNDVLIFSYLACESKEVLVNGKKEINVTLKESTSDLDKVTVIGSGVQRKAS